MWLPSYSGRPPWATDGEIGSALPANTHCCLESGAPLPTLLLTELRQVVDFGRLVACWRVRAAESGAVIQE